MTMDKALEQEIRRRAAGMCEYCHFPESLSELRHVADHIVAKQHGGPTSAANLALCCGRCNSHKGPNVAGIDPQTGLLARLFNPRLDTWSDHFAWEGALLLGLTDVGRVTVAVLNINHQRRLVFRRALILAGKLTPR